MGRSTEMINNRMVIMLFFVLLLLSARGCSSSSVVSNDDGGGSSNVVSGGDDDLWRRTLLQSNGLGKTPPMGWNSWNHFNCHIEEKLIRETADAMVSSGLAAVGYSYINLDDCWAELNRDSGVCWLQLNGSS